MGKRSYEKTEKNESIISKNNAMINAYQVQVEQLQDCVDNLRRYIEDISLQYPNQNILNIYTNDEDSWSGTNQKEFNQGIWTDYLKGIRAFQELVGEKVRAANVKKKELSDEIDKLKFINRLL